MLMELCKTCGREHEDKAKLCSICLTQKVLRGKWKLVILWLLKDEKKRFNQLQRELDIRQGSLTQQLRELEEDGLVHREVYKVVPPKVEYWLTDLGKEFLLVMDSMEQWGGKFINHKMNEME